MKVLLDAYLNKNLGDDLFLKIISDRYKNVDFIALPHCNYNKNTFSENVIFKRNFFTRLLNKTFGKKKLVFNHYKKKCDLQVSIGGSIFIEKMENKKSLDNFIFNKYYKTKKPFFIISSNFGPYKHNYFLNEYSKVFMKSEDTCFRDNYSKNLFSSYKNIRMAPDVVFSLDTKPYFSKEEKIIIISIIDLSSRNDLSKFEKKYINKINEIINYFKSIEYKIILMSFCDSEGDNKTINKILEQNHNLSRDDTFNYDGNIESALKLISSCEYIIATRFHAMILGFVFNKKVLPLIYSKKTENVINDLGYIGPYINISKIEDLDIKKIMPSLKTDLIDLKTIKRKASKQFKELDFYIKNKVK